MRRTVVLGGLALAGLLLAGCTLVPTASAPNVISPKTVHFGLLGKTIPGTINGHVTFITQPVYIVDATGHLSPSSRIVPTPPTLASVLQELTLGPTPIEAATGFTSALPRSLVIVQAVVRHHIGYLDLATPLSTLSPQRAILATGQLTLTAADVGATHGIEITVAGVVQRSPLPHGGSADVVTARDYQSLLNG
jgi:hypothetical protein